MKKIIVSLMLLALCLTLCACGGESAELPTRPAQTTSPKLPATDSVPGETRSSSEPSAPADGTESAEGKYPWEVEFNEKDFVKFNVTAPSGEKITTWKEGSMYGTERRYLCRYPNGDILDEYYYPSGNTSHKYKWGADGSYSERCYLDDGYVDAATKIIYMGTIVYQRDIYADGSEYEQICDDNGIPIFYSNKLADGSYEETRYFEDGTSKYVYDNPVTGKHSEEEYFENGNIKKSISDDPETGTYSEYERYEDGSVKTVYKDAATEVYSEQEFYENGDLKYSKNQSPEYTAENSYDEDGYCTYVYMKDTANEIECIADESGMLVKYIENGTVYENDVIPDWVAGSYNFRG